MRVLPWPAPRRTWNKPKAHAAVTPASQQMIAVGLAGGLCGAAVATAGLLIVQAAFAHGSCALTPGVGLGASYSPSLPSNPPEPPDSET